jgi:uncharacterized protein YbbK (DUF523 family)
VAQLVKEGKAIAVCPEQMAGMPTPRPPAEQVDGRVISKDGTDMTAQFDRGAREALKMAQIAKCDKAILKSKSPSCGCGKVYDGTFTGTLIERDGVFARLLKLNGIEVVTEQSCG